MSERDIILLAVGAVMGYCFCFAVEIYKVTKFEEPPPPSPPYQREKDPADWWKDCQ